MADSEHWKIWIFRLKELRDGLGSAGKGKISPTICCFPDITANDVDFSVTQNESYLNFLYKQADFELKRDTLKEDGRGLEGTFLEKQRKREKKGFGETTAKRVEARSLEGLGKKEAAPTLATMFPPREFTEQGLLGETLF
ncbi:hypothetical protein V1477_006543, partial [Vespula maculifrons]